MRYLRNSDYRYKITKEDFSSISEDSEHADHFIHDAELTAQSKIELYLRKRYDLPTLFKVYSDFTSGATYQSGSTVWYGSASGSTEYLYTVSVSGTTQNPDMNDWALSDPRYQVIKDWMITISLYHLHEKLAPENIPTHRKESYTEAMKTLKMIQEGKLSPDFPEIENRISTISIGGSTGDCFMY